MISRALALLFVLLFAVGASAAPAKKKKKAKKDEYEGSKYKSYRVLTDGEPKTYRFDERGEPIPAAKPKKKKKKKLSSDDSDAACADDPASAACDPRPEGEPQP